MRGLCLFLLLLSSCTGGIDGFNASDAGPHSFLLPSRVHAIVGEPLVFHAENTIVSEELVGPSDYHFGVELGDVDLVSSVAGDDLTLTVGTAGEFSLGVRANNMAGSTTVSAVQQIAPGPFLVLMLGDSLTANGLYPARVQELILPAGGVVDERGVSGKTWPWHLTDPASPVFNIAILDVVPDIVVWALGTNGIATAYNVPGYDAYETAELDAAETLLTDPSWPPWTKHVVVFAPPGNERYASFASLDGAGVGDLSWFREKNHRINRAYLTRLNDLPNVHVAPVYLDRMNDYPMDNFAHPTASGYSKMGDHVAAAVLYAIQNGCEE